MRQIDKNELCELLSVMHELLLPFKFSIAYAEMTLSDEQYTKIIEDDLMDCVLDFENKLFDGIIGQPVIQEDIDNKKEKLRLAFEALDNDVKQPYSIKLEVDDVFPKPKDDLTVWICKGLQYIDSSTDESKRKEYYNLFIDLLVKFSAGMVMARGGENEIFDPDDIEWI